MTYSSMSCDGEYSLHHANLRVLCGTQPGLLDPSQPSRLLRFPDSKLSFASFDPKTALAEDPGVQKPTDSGNLAPPKRIVIETTSKGASFWRFVPRARLEEGAHDEGIWPRVVDICGEKIQCYQEQWEIYKLDPKYYCVVYPWPKYPTVTWVESPHQDFDAADPYSGKRTRRLSPETSELFIPKKARSRPPDEVDESDLDSDSDEVEVVEIVMGARSQKPRSGRKPAHTGREEVMKARFERWAKHRMVHEKRGRDTAVPADGSFSMQVDSEDTFPSQSSAWSTEEHPKRKAEPPPEPDNDTDQMSCDRTPRGPKRSRMKSPQRSNKRVSRSPDKRRVERLRKHAEINRRPKEKRYTDPLHFTFVPPEPMLEEEDDAISSSSDKHSQEDDAQEETSETERLHEAEIAESIRKMQELERDRPIWEAQRKQREARERAEEQEHLARAERRRREELERLKQQREAAERAERRAKEEAEKVAREARRQREQHQRRQKHRWESGPWTTHRALERYRMLCEEFDAAKFTPGQPITFGDIPWPVLHAPSRLRVEDVDWSAVETFFTTVKNHMRLQDFREFVEKSHRRFHPDRWRARRIWAAVTDEVERGYLEVAANTVAQAITPIWRGVKER